MRKSHLPRSAARLRPIRTIHDLQADPRNANRGTNRGRDLLDHSLSTVGLGRSIVAAADNIVLAGSKTLAAAQRRNVPVRVVDTDGGELVVVRRRDLLASDLRAKELAVLDNRTSELDLAWDPNVLAALKAEGVALDALWTDEEFRALLAEAPSTGLTDENAVLAPPEATDITRGDLFVLGRHRLLCGDATDAGDVRTVLDAHRPIVLATDPPYGVAYDPAWRHRAFPGQRTATGAVLNDTNFDLTPALQLFRGPVAYVWHAGIHAAVTARALDDAGLVIRAQIIWQKQHFALSRGDYHWQHEPCWYAVRKGQSSRWRGDRRQTTVWCTPNLNPMGGSRVGENAPTGHSTQKPVWLFEVPLQNHTRPGEVVYDPFLGSGTTIIAAEKTDRVCVALELDPRYVQVAVTRWEQFTGQQARRLRPARRRRIS